jgi:hypothetical protein
MKKKIKTTCFLILIAFLSFLSIEILLRGAYEVRDVFRTVIASSDFYNKYIRPELAGFTESGRNNLIREIVYDASENRPLRFNHSISSSFQYTSFLEYIPRKNFSDKGYHINQYHLRYNDNFPKKKESNEVRIFVTGGSTAFGMGVPQSETYAYVLEKSLRAQYPKLKIRVLIAAVGSYVSTQERIFFENIVFPLNPDIVMMFSGWNDSYYGHRGANVSYGYEMLGLNKLLIEREQNPRDWIKMGDINYFVDPPKYKDYDSKILLFIDKFLYKKKIPNAAALQKAVSEISMEHRSVYDLLELNIHIIKTLCDSIGSKFIFYLQPSLFATKKNKLSKYEKLMHEQIYKNYHGILADYNSKVYQIYRKLLPVDATNKGYTFVDGDNAIKFEEKTVFSDEVHFDDRGNRLFAEHMFKILNPLIDEIAAKRTASQL